MSFDANIDYLLFLSGVAFVVIAIHAISLHRSEDRMVPWYWLAVFALMWAVIDWSKMLGAGALGIQWIGFAELGLASGAYLALVEFWREGLRRQSGRAPAWWLVVLPAVAIIAAAAAGQWDAAMSIAYVFGLASCVAGAVALLGAVPIDDRVGRAAIAVAAGALGLLGFVSVFSLSSGAVGSGLGTSGLSSVTGIPLDLLRTLLVGLIAWQLGLYAQRSSEREAPGGGYGVRVMNVLTIALAVLAIALGWFFTDASGKAAERDATSALLVRANVAAAAIDLADLEGLSGRAEDESKPSYRKIQNRLTKVLSASEQDTFMYLMALRGGRVVFVADAAPYRFDSEPDTPGTVYNDPSDELIAALQAPVAFVEGPVVDDYGVWYSALVPVGPAASGRGPVLLGLDQAAIDVSDRIAEARMGAIMLLLAASALLLGVYGVARITRVWSVRRAASEHRFRTMFEHAPEAIFIVDRATSEIAVANPHMHEWLGYSPGALIGVSLDTLAAEDGTSGEPCLLMADGDGPAKRECTYKRANGTLVDVEVTAVPIKPDGGAGLLVFARDVTVRKRAEESIAYRARFNEVVVDISTGFINTGVERIDERVEQALEMIGRFLGADRAYVLETTPDGLTMSNTHEWTALGALERKADLQGVSTDRFPTMMATLAEGRDLVVLDTSSGGSLRPEEREEFVAQGVHSIAAVPMLWRGEFFGVLGFDTMSAGATWTDDAVALLHLAADAITGAIQRKRTSLEVRRLSRALEQSPVAVVIADRDGSIRYVNQKFTSLTSYSIGHVRGRDLGIFKAPDTPEYLVREMQQAVSAGRDWSADVENRRADGTLYWASEVVSSIRDYEGNVAEIISVHADVTAIKEAEHALIDAKQAAESASKAKSEFLAAMSHEIRTPMNAIIGMAELLEDTSLDLQQERYVEIFKSAGESLLSLINDVLDLSKIEAGRLDVEHMPFDVADLVERSASVVGVKAREKGLELLYRVAPGTHTAVRGDPDRLQQVLTNLLGNAVKFTEEGQVVLTVEAEPGASPNGEEGVVLRFSVMDTGIGIPGEKHDIVFESFTQADSSTTRRYGGTGLGLAISRRLVELMGGRIWLESEVGRGSTFRVALPFETADLPGAERAEGVSDLEGCHMLVVDDNPTNRLILREMLGGWGATVDEAEDGLQGVDKLTRASSEGTTYDVVVLDNRMPNMDGMGFLEIVRGDEALSGVGVVMLSSEAGTNLLERLRPLGVTDYLTKPVRRSDLHDALVHAASVTRASEMAEEVSAPAVLESPTDTRPLRIMLVDDSEDNRFLVEAHLSKLPYTLHTAEDGQAAVDRFEQSEGGYDLILMDMQMPVMDGYDATRAIRLLEAERSWPRTSIVALTAYALNEESQRSIDAGCDGHLAKPIKKRALLDAIIHYTGGGSDE